MKFKSLKEEKEDILLDNKPNKTRINYKSSRERYLKKNKKELFIFSGIVSFVLLFIIFINTSYFNVKAVSVEGNFQIEKTEIESYIDYNEKLWQVDTSELAENIKNSEVLIKDITINKSYLNTLNIAIVEKKIVAQEENADGQYTKLLENSEVLSDIISVKNSVPILENFLEQEELKKDVLVNLAELNSEVLNRTSEIILDEGGTTITIYMKDGQKIKADPKSFSEKLNYYLKIEKLIEKKSDSVLNIVNGVYLETENSNRIKEDRIKQIIQESNSQPEETTATQSESNTKTNDE